MSDKVKPHHLARKAILYVRQSSTHQVLHNRESQALQYAMRDRLLALGWSQVDTGGGDLGRSAAGGVTRVGFERMQDIAERLIPHGREKPVIAVSHPFKSGTGVALRDL